MSYRFWWDELNIEHIADHGVEPYEAEEVLYDDALFIVRAGKDRCAAHDQSDSGRYLLEVYARKSNQRPLSSPHAT